MHMLKNFGLVAFLVTILLSSIAFSLALQSSVVLPSSGSIDYPAEYTFGIVGSIVQNPAVNNFCWLFGNQSISYRIVNPQQIGNFADVDLFDGLVIWTRGDYSYNTTAIKMFAQTHVVICDIREFCENLYPSLSTSFQVVNTGTVTYSRDWGNFRTGDLVEMRNETGNIDRLTTVLSSGLASYSNVTTIARYDASRTAFLHMNGTTANSGLYVMDLDATTPDTEWAGIWHLFPTIKMVKDFPTGKYSRWMANGSSWWDLTWVYNRIEALVATNRDILDRLVIGKSVQGRNITAIVVGKGSRNIIIDACIHGTEKAPTFASLRMVELLLEFYHSDPLWQSRLLSDWRVIIIPVLNPDGFAANTGKENANGIDLNHQFPPGANTTEPEDWALRWLMGNYTPTVYVNMHEGYYWFPNHMMAGNYEQNPNLNTTMNAMRQASGVFASLKHWGWFTWNGTSTWIGKVSQIYKAGYPSTMAIAYASYEYNASCLLLESLVWSQTYNGRQCLWAMDYYCTLVLAFLENNGRLT